MMLKRWMICVAVAVAGACSAPAPSPTATLTHLPTRPARVSPTVTPSSTSTIEPTPTTTRTPAPTPTATETPDFIATAMGYAAYLAAVAEAVMTAAPARVMQADTSPDGRWKIDLVIHDCVEVTPGSEWGESAYQRMTLTDLSTGAVTNVADQVQDCGGGLGVYGLSGFTWSPNSQYFYFTDANSGAPDGACGYWPRPVQRVGVATGTVEYVGGAHFSPDMSRLAFWQDADVVVWTLDEGEVARFAGLIGPNDPNTIAWSPDGRALVYLQNDSECNPYSLSVVTRIDLAERRQTQVLGPAAPVFTWLVWDAPNRITLYDNQGHTWRYNFITQEVSQVI